MDLFFSLGGWWSVSSFGEITGTVAIEMQNKSYIHALDTGLFTLGSPHKGKRRDWGYIQIELIFFQRFSYFCSSWLILETVEVIS